MSSVAIPVYLPILGSLWFCLLSVTSSHCFPSYLGLCCLLLSHSCLYSKAAVTHSPLCSQREDMRVLPWLPSFLEILLKARVWPCPPLQSLLTRAVWPLGSSGLGWMKNCPGPHTDVQPMTFRWGEHTWIYFVWHCNATLSPGKSVEEPHNQARKDPQETHTGLSKLTA